MKAAINESQVYINLRFSQTEERNGAPGAVIESALHRVNTVDRNNLRTLSETWLKLQ